MEAESKSTSKQTLCNLLQMFDAARNCLDQAAIACEGGIHPKHRLTKYHDFFSKRLRKNEHVLDVGCGIGAVAFSMVKVGAHVTGIDMSAENIAKAQQLHKHPNLRFITGKVPTTKISGCFDVVVLSNVLEHIEKREEFLRELQKTYSPHRWLIRVPMLDRDWIVPMKQELGLLPYSDPTHFTEYTHESFHEEMRRAGLVVTFYQIQWGELWSEVRAVGELPSLTNNMSSL
jgi:ubiquinone/menaquinone biosynthesis C-methylase UbiE